MAITPLHTVGSSPISPLWDSMPVNKQPSAVPQGPTGNGESFTDIFQTAIQNVKDTDKDVVQLEYLLSTGQLDNPAELSIAQYKATVAVNLLVSLRDSAMEAYNKLTSMNM